MCMVYFHSVDFVLGRTEVLRRAWSCRCHLPRALFHPPKRRSSSAQKCYDYPLFKRMLLCKSVVYANNKRMFQLYEKYCEEATLSKYWGEDANTDEEALITPADVTNEIVEEDGF